VFSKYALNIEVQIHYFWILDQHNLVSWFRPCTVHTECIEKATGMPSKFGRKAEQQWSFYNQGRLPLYKQIQSCPQLCVQKSVHQTVLESNTLSPGAHSFSVTGGGLWLENKVIPGCMVHHMSFRRCLEKSVMYSLLRYVQIRNNDEIKDIIQVFCTLKSLDAANDHCPLLEIWQSNHCERNQITSWNRQQKR